MSALLDHPHKHPISAEEFLRMGEAGVFAPDARLELIEGEIFEMAPIHPPHAGRVNRLTSLFVHKVGDRAVVSVQNPVIASALSVPQPDLTVLAARADFYSSSHPTPADVLLVVEVSDSTLAHDLKRKVPMYARGGVREVWVVDIPGQGLHVFRNPSQGGYGAAFVAHAGDRVACEALPEVSLQVAELFPD